MLHGIKYCNYIIFPKLLWKAARHNVFYCNRTLSVIYLDFTSLLNDFTSVKSLKYEYCLMYQHSMISRRLSQLSSLYERSFELIVEIFCCRMMAMLVWE